MGWIIAVLTFVFIVEVGIRIPILRVCLGFVENVPNFGVNPASPNDDAEKIEFKTTNDLTLRGSLYRQRTRSSHPIPSNHEDETDPPATATAKAPRGLILFCPEYGGNHWMALQYCQGLWDAGYDILSFDFRNQGESDAMENYAPIHWLTQYEVQDAQAALRYIENDPELSQLELGIFGISRGGSAALALACLERHLKCVATDSAFSADSMMMYHSKRWAPLIVPAWLLKLLPDFHVYSTLKIVQWISRFKSGYKYFILERVFSKLRSKSVFLISGKRDTYVPAVITERMKKRIGGDNVQTWVVKKAKHNMARTIVPDEYDQRLVDFFDRNLVSQETAEANPEKAESVRS